MYQSKNSALVEKLCSSCNKGWKDYSYVEGSCAIERYSAFYFLLYYGYDAEEMRAMLSRV
jgi:hypothetical protein